MSMDTGAMTFGLSRFLLILAVLGCFCMTGMAQPFAYVEDTPGGPTYVQGQILVEFDVGVSDAVLHDALQKAALRPLRGLLTAAMKARGLNEISVLETQLPVPTAIAFLQQHPAVKRVQPNWVYQHCEVSNDPYYTGGSLWGMYGDATSPANQYGSQAGEAWATGKIGNSSVYVGVIDEGIMYTHPDLAANIWTNPFDPVDGVDNDGNGKIDDIHGWDFYNNDNTVYDSSRDDHATHVAGTIGAIGGNDVGVVGVNWHVTMISAKFLGPYGGTTVDAIEAIDYFVDLKTRHGFNLVAINNSWGGGGYDLGLEGAIFRAGQAGILFVAAAGNDGVNIDTTDYYPAGYTDPAVIAVAAIDSNGKLASFSNYGATKVHLGAPGVSIYSTLPNWKNQPTYGSYSGTSMATPHVTGAIALYAAANPDKTAAEIKAALLANTTATPSLGGKTVTGGRLNVGALLAFNSNNKAPVADNQSVTVDEDFPLAITLTGSDADGDALTFAVVNDPVHGTLSGTAPNLTYTPSANYNGPDSITFKVNDGTVDSPIATISISVTPVNDAPIANPQSVTVTQDDSLALTLTGSDADGDALTFVVVSNPVHGTLSGTAPNLTYTPSANYNGSDSFTFKVNDGTVDSAEATVSVNVLPAGNIVTVAGISYSTTGGKSGKSHLLVKMSLKDNAGSPVASASVSADIVNNTTSQARHMTGTTDSAGVVTFQWNNAPAGTYTTEVTQVVASGLTWDGITPPNSFVK